MKKTMLTMALIVTALGLHAQEKKQRAKNEPTAQQALMATCNKEATGMKATSTRGSCPSA